MCLQVVPHDDGVDFTLVKEKAAKWLDDINTAIANAYLDSGSAQKLSGKHFVSISFRSACTSTCSDAQNISSSAAVASTHVASSRFIELFID